MSFEKIYLDEKETLILSELRRNSRQSLVEISKKTDIPISTVFDKIRKIEEMLIVKHVSLVDFSKIGFNIRVAIFIKADKKDELRDFLINHKDINIVSRINNADFFIEAIFRKMGEFYDFLEAMEKFGIQEISYHHVEEDLKREEMLC